MTTGESLLSAALRDELHATRENLLDSRAAEALARAENIRLRSMLHEARRTMSDAARIARAIEYSPGPHKVIRVLVAICVVQLAAIVILLAQR